MITGLHLERLHAEDVDVAIGTEIRGPDVVQVINLQRAHLPGSTGGAQIHQQAARTLILGGDDVAPAVLVEVRDHEVVHVVEPASEDLFRPVTRAWIGRPLEPGSSPLSSEMLITMSMRPSASISTTFTLAN